MQSVTFGHVTARMAIVLWGGARVWLDDEEVTERCLEAHDTDGWVLLQRLQDGHPYIDRERNELATELRQGAVRIVPNRPAP